MVAIYVVCKFSYLELHYNQLRQHNLRIKIFNDFVDVWEKISKIFILKSMLPRAHPQKFIHKLFYQSTYFDNP